MDSKPTRVRVPPHTALSIVATSITTGHDPISAATEFCDASSMRTTTLTCQKRPTSLQYSLTEKVRGSPSLPVARHGPIACGAHYSMLFSQHHRQTKAVDPSRNLSRGQSIDISALGGARRRIWSVLDGSKTIESRFSSRPIPPYGHVSAGDTILLKPPSEPICGICTVAESWQYRLTEASRSEVREHFGPFLQAQMGFWESRASARYAALHTLANVAATTPIPIAKSATGAAGWSFPLRNADELGPVRVLIGVAGGIGSGKSSIASALATELDGERRSFGDAVRSEARRRGLARIEQRCRNSATP